MARPDLPHFQASSMLTTCRSHDEVRMHSFPADRCDNGAGLVVCKTDPPLHRQRKPHNVKCICCSKEVVDLRLHSHQDELGD